MSAKTRVRPMLAALCCMAASVWAVSCLSGTGFALPPVAEGARSRALRAGLASSPESSHQTASRDVARSSVLAQLATIGIVTLAAGAFIGKRTAVPDAATKLVGEAPCVLPLSAARGMAEISETARGSRVIAYNKVKRGPYAMKRRQAMWLDFSKTYKGRRRNVFTIAKGAVMKSLKFQYKSRRLFKRHRRRLWIMRINANCKLHGITYKQLICKLKEAKININRKILSQLGIYDRSVFTNIMDIAVPNWKDVKALRDYERPAATPEEIDSYALPFLEKHVPELYTDSWIRFNRQVNDWGVQYTVDMGDPERWREILPKMPEMANFQIGDVFLGNSNAELQPYRLENLAYTDEEAPKEYTKFLQRIEKTKLEDEEKKAKGEETWPLRDVPLTRDAWFEDEPQTWF